MRGATDGVVVPLLGDGISIHAPRAGRDREMVAIRAYVHCIFQSTRPVRGATCSCLILSPKTLNFNPRAPCGARLKRLPAHSTNQTISIHAPRAGRDNMTDEQYRHLVISIHAPRAGRDNMTDEQYRHLVISIHAPRAGRDQYRLAAQVSRQNFNPRAPCGARLSQNGSSPFSSSISIHAPRAGRDQRPPRSWRS